MWWKFRRYTLDDITQNGTALFLIGFTHDTLNLNFLCGIGLFSGCWEQYYSAFHFQLTSIQPSTPQSVNPSIHLSIYPPIHPPTHPTIHPSHDPSHDASSQSHYIHPMNQPSINPWIHPRINQSSDLQLCLSSLIMSLLVGAALLNHPFCLFVWWHIIPPFLLDGYLKKYYIKLSPVLSREGKAGPCMLAILLIFFYSQWQIFCRGFLLVLPSSSKAMTPNLKLVTVIVTLNIFWLNSQERPFV